MSAIAPTASARRHRAQWRLGEGAGDGGEYGAPESARLSVIDGGNYRPILWLGLAMPTPSVAQGRQAEKR
ncbi:MAG: hypothetical protein QM803_00490 [Rhodocyclaceae bacterium]